ncbi:MAG: hypothetical protein QOD26_856 [Betaproteobacteria bacterium]|jgi:hypothetical protein|nr:hypothetical protein [Betaproteobacteria bacterium]
MRRALTACALSTWVVAAQAQGIPPATSAPPPPTMQSPTQGPVPATTQQSQRGNIAPVVDIRIQGEGISLPKGVGEAPPREKPPAR